MFTKTITAIATAVMLSGASISPAFAAEGDSDISRSIEKESRVFPPDYKNHVSVHTSDGTVYLRGRVADFSEIVRVEGIAKSTPGVKKVVNQLDIDSGN